MKKLFLIFVFVFVAFLNISAQTKSASPNSQIIKSSAAYAEVLLRKAELKAEVESLLESYTEDYPKLKESRHELMVLQKDLDKMLAQKDASMMSQPLGKLIVKRASLDTDLWVLQNKYGAEHPEVKRARRKLESFNEAIQEIMP